MKKSIKNNKIKIISLLLIMIAILLPIYKKINQKKLVEKDNIRVFKYIAETSSEETEKTTYKALEYNYIGVLEIPSINLKRGLVNKYSKYNDISYNVAILDGSNMPNINNSNLILAAHNGNSSVSFFKDLDKLTEKDEIYIYYDGYKYIYKMYNHYEVEKNGEAIIERDRTVNTLTLITCKNDSDTEQIIYIAYLIGKETY